ncbi:hypothetical protein RA955_07215 [Geobacillus proteiniphilus]|uniref:DUF1641 domain-containing protein n=1 Tax=Geobacillus proteiniphilus TaxID=860353 RepID=A0ABY9MIH0_9BACL|nr:MULTISPECIES: hypothetical protein [Geobacillus]MED4972144.1 hypothetical protein [Geobacillus thermoleovorans]OPX00423.1 hypothetical protein B1A75_18060 [Geobacillus sp. LEMMY01]QCK82233.1 hypothetical protein E5Z46_08230 [Geobacillus kaustophilus NBRC 102445]WMJ17812.1 hypothetical protein RA955_07215 [Geobacillus proteiniphilus]
MSLEPVLQLLENDEQREAIHYFIEKLPQLKKAMESAEEKIAVVQHVMNDKQSLEALFTELEEKTAPFRLTTEHVEAFSTLIQLLPILVQWLQKAEEFILFVTSVMNDRESMAYLMQGVKDMVPIEKGLDILKETNERFARERDSSTVSLLRMYRLLKHPLIQDGVKYIETLLDVASKHKSYGGM